MLVKSIHTVYWILTRSQAKFNVVTVCMIVLFILAGNAYGTNSTVFADSPGSLEEFNFVIALPGRECRVPALSSWSRAEKWAWKKICENKHVDFNEHLNENLDPKNPDHSDKWADGRRTISATFLITILLFEPFRSTIPYRGVHISGAFIHGEIDLTDAVIERPLYLLDSIFSSEVKLSSLFTPMSVAFSGSRFDGKFSMNFASTGSSLLMDDAQFSTVDLRVAKIGDVLNMDGSTFYGELNMDAISVGSSLLMRNDAQFSTVHLTVAKIGDVLNMDGSTFYGELNMDAISVGSSLLMRNDAQFSTVHLTVAKIGDVLNMDGSTFYGELNMDAISVGNSLIMQDYAQFSTVSLVEAEIGRRLTMKGSTFNGELNMHAIKVGSSLFMNDAQFSTVKLVEAKIGRQLAMNGSTFNGELNMHAIKVGSSLFMHDAQFSTVDLRVAKIGDDLFMIDSDFNDELNMNSIKVGSSLSMDYAQFSTVDLDAAQISEVLGMNGSTFNGELNMNSIKVGSSLFMQDDAQFSTVDLRVAKIGDLLTMDGSDFYSELKMGAISVGNSLFMRNDAQFSTVRLVEAKIGRQLAMNGSTFNGELNMNSIKVGSSLLMHDAQFSTVELDAAQISEVLAMNGSTFNGELNMHAIKVGSSLFMNDAQFSTVDLAEAKIGGKLGMHDSTFYGELEMESALVGSSFIIRDAEFYKKTNLKFLSVGSILEIQGGILRTLDLTGARIEQTLKLSGLDQKWKKLELVDKTLQSPKMTLKNTEVNVLQDTDSSWPDNLELEGFTYNQLAGSHSTRQEMPLQRGSEWYINWLKDDKTYSPQPYRQLAGVLHTAGLEEMANDILFESRVREREEAKFWFRKVWLWLLEITIGYGYGWQIFRVLGWAALFLSIGISSLYWEDKTEKKEDLLGFWKKFWYSLDMLLPIIRLREQHYELDLKGGAQIYFYLHKIFGYAIVFFVIAGMTGLTE